MGVREGAVWFLAFDWVDLGYCWLRTGASSLRFSQGRATPPSTQTSILRWHRHYRSALCIVRKGRAPSYGSSQPKSKARR